MVLFTPVGNNKRAVKEFYLPLPGVLECLAISDHGNSYVTHFRINFILWTVKSVMENLKGCTESAHGAAIWWMAVNH